MTLYDVIQKLKVNGSMLLMYDGKDYPRDLADIVVSDGYLECTRKVAGSIADMARISTKYVVIRWAHLLTMTRVRKTKTGYDNVYCTKEMRILCADEGLKIVKKIPLEGNGEEIWILKKVN